MDKNVEGMKKQSNNNEYSIVVSLTPPDGCGERDVSYSVWAIMTKYAAKERATRIEIGIWGAYILSFTLEGISLKEQIVLFYDSIVYDSADGEDVILEFNPECGTKIRFDGRDVIDLKPSNKVILPANMVSQNCTLNKNYRFKPLKFTLHPSLGQGVKSVSYVLWDRILSFITKINPIEIEVGIWGAYTLGHIVDGISLTAPIVIAKNGYGDDVTLKFNPSCGKMIRFDGTDLIELIPGEMEEIIIR